MKKNQIISFILVMVLMCMTFSSCGELQTTCVADAEFLYSIDNGQTYKSNSVMFNVGQEVSMMINIDASTQEQKSITAVLTVPNTESVEISFMNGPTVSPTIDPVTGATSYNFAIPTTGEISVVFALLANEEAEISMSLKFDDSVDPSQDKIETICFVKN